MSKLSLNRRLSMIHRTPFIRCRNHLAKLTFY